MYNAPMSHNIRIYGYLRALTDEQDASRAKNDLFEFADKMGYPVVYWFEENESGLVYIALNSFVSLTSRCQAALSWLSKLTK